MAKKKTTKKKSTAKKAPTRKKSAAKKTSKKPATRKKPVAKKKSSKKPAASKKKAAKKKTTTKTAKKAAKTSKKSSKKTASKKIQKKTSKKAPLRKKVASKKSTSKKTSSKASTSKKASSKKTASTKDDPKSGRKGITVVEKKKKRRTSRNAAKSKASYKSPVPSLLGPGSTWKPKGPLIPSGPKNVVETDDIEGSASRAKKSPFNKRKLDKFKAILVQKRAEVFGDLEDLETGALRSGGSGGLSNLPQHLAEQGTDSADQSLSLNLAEGERKLIREIDAALERIASRTYGLCELTKKPIAEARLEELPWARYSIEAARIMEKGGH